MFKDFLFKLQSLLNDFVYKMFLGEPFVIGLENRRNETRCKKIANNIISLLEVNYTLAVKLNIGFSTVLTVLLSSLIFFLVRNITSAHNNSKKSLIHPAK